LAAEFAHSYRDLNVPDKAIYYAERALSLHGPLYVRSKSFCSAVLAAGHIGEGEIDRGIELADDVVSVVSALRSGRCNAYIHDFIKRLAPYGTHRPVADFISRTGITLGSSN
jgi:hypothetical protein